MYWVLKFFHLAGILAVFALFVALLFFKVDFYLTAVVFVIGAFSLWGSIDSLASTVTKIEATGNGVTLVKPFGKTKITKLHSRKVNAVKIGGFSTVYEMELDTGSEVLVIDDCYTFLDNEGLEKQLAAMSKK